MAGPGRTYVTELMDMDEIMGGSQSFPRQHQGHHQLHHAYPQEGFRYGAPPPGPVAPYEREDFKFGAPPQSRVPSAIRQSYGGPPQNSGMGPPGMGPPGGMGSMGAGPVVAPRNGQVVAPEMYEPPRKEIREYFSDEPNCLTISNHVKDCPVCGSLYANDRTLYIIVIIVLVVICLLLLKKVLDNRK